MAFAITARNPPPLFGTGLIDRLADTELERVARQQPPSTRGRVHRLKGGRIGRFGWRAQVASLEDFVLGACANELGLEVPGHHQAASPLDPAAKAKTLDLAQDECDALVQYVRSLPPPNVLEPSGSQGSAAMEGRRLFQSVGCESCHIADLGSVRGIYSDLLLHDMGEELSDPGSYDTEESTTLDRLKRGEWRTPPLWGFRDSAPYLHDGRARNLEQAVVLHGGQGAASVRRFRALDPGQQSQVLAFLNSLAAPGPAPRASRGPGTQAEPRDGRRRRGLRPGTAVVPPGGPRGRAGAARRGAAPGRGADRLASSGAALGGSAAEGLGAPRCVAA